MSSSAVPPSTGPTPIRTSSGSIGSPAGPAAPGEADIGGETTAHDAGPVRGAQEAAAKAKMAQDGGELPANNSSGLTLTNIPGQAGKAAETGDAGQTTQGADAAKDFGKLLEQNAKRREQLDGRLKDAEKESDGPLKDVLTHAIKEDLASVDGQAKTLLREQNTANEASLKESLIKANQMLDDDPLKEPMIRTIVSEFQALDRQRALLDK